MKTILKAAVLLIISLALLCTSGCLMNSIDDLYSLPKPSEEYIKLQTLLDEQIDTGSEYASPTSGSYRRSVQLYDIDGDGTDEAIAFFRDSKQVLKICIYERADEDFFLATTIDGEGTAIGSIEYADLDGNGSTELLVAWQIGTGVRLLKVYSLTGSNSSVLLTADCTEFIVWDMDGDSRLELLVLTYNGENGGEVEMYSLGKDNESSSVKAPLSLGMTTVDRMRTGYLSDGVPAIFVEGAYGENELLTDVFAFVEGSFSNIALDEAGESGTLRDYDIYCSDIDGDKAMEIPKSIQLFSQSESSSVYRVFDWYGINSAGSLTLDLSTYHSTSDGWYFVIPKALRADLTVRREDSIMGERAVILSSYFPESGQVKDFLAIYTLTGENRFDRAEIGDRFILLYEEATTYAAKILSDSLSQEEAIKSFKLIYNEWITGAL